MRIFLFVVYYLPSPIASAKLIHDLAVEFTHMGHDVTVVAPDDRIGQDSQYSREEGIDVLRIRTGKIKAASRWLRAINEIRLSETMWHQGKRYFEDHPCDLIVYYSPTIFFGALVAKLKDLNRCPSYLILRDIFPQWSVDAGLLGQNSIIYQYFKRMELQNYWAADIIGVQSPANLHYFSDRGLDRIFRLEVLYNWASTTEDRVHTDSYRNRMGLKDKIVFFYGGNIGIAQDMDNIIRLAENLRSDPSAFFLLVGDGTEVARLREIIATRGLSNIAIHPSVDQDSYLAMLSEFDVGLISLDRGLKTQNFPGKMLSYMDKAKPILASINPGNDLKEVIEENHAGLVCVNGDDACLADYAVRLIADASLRRELGLNARRLLQGAFSVTSAARQILSHFCEEAAEACPASFDCVVSVVLYRNPSWMIENILTGVLDTSLNIKLYIIDNSPEPLSMSNLERENVFYHHIGHNLGYGKGHNWCICRSEPSKYSLILNPDVIIPKGVIEALSDYLDRHPDVGMVCPWVLNKDQSLQHLNKRPPNVLDLFLRRFSLDGTAFPFLKKRLDRYEMRDVGYEDIYEVPFMTGAFMFCRTEVLKKVGGFDPRFFLYFEDADLSRRFQREGYKTVYYPYVHITHLWQRESQKNWKMSLVFILSGMKYFRKWGWKLY
ncbi:MAG: hypothetical protein CSYNP_00069 [Syntrophus sp. SKADARSKE-3]|nr:hypothetical protein [Syntrophus sp. SKADARSKE-3]